MQAISVAGQLKFRAGNRNIAYLSPNKTELWAIAIVPLNETLNLSLTQEITLVISVLYVSSDKSVS